MLYYILELRTSKIWEGCAKPPWYLMLALNTLASEGLKVVRERFCLKKLSKFVRLVYFFCRWGGEEIHGDVLDIFLSSVQVLACHELVMCYNSLV